MLRADNRSPPACLPPACAAARELSDYPAPAHAELPLSQPGRSHLRGGGSALGLQLHQRLPRHRAGGPGQRRGPGRGRELPVATASGLPQRHRRLRGVAVRLKGKAPNTARHRREDHRARRRPCPMQSQEMQCGGRYLSSDQPLRVFAAGTLTNRLTFEVRWRSGLRSLITNLEPNCLVEVDEAAARPPTQTPDPRPRSRIPDPRPYSTTSAPSSITPTWRFPITTWNVSRCSTSFSAVPVLAWDGWTWTGTARRSW